MTNEVKRLFDNITRLIETGAYKDEAEAFSSEYADVEHIRDLNDLLEEELENFYNE